jgi:ribosomal protein S15P/S13E
MNELATLLEFAQTAPWLVVFFIAWKAGMLDFKKTGEDKMSFKEQILVLTEKINKIADRLTAHLDDEDQKNIMLNDKLEKLSSDVSYVRGKMDK